MISQPWNQNEIINLTDICKLREKIKLTHLSESLQEHSSTRSGQLCRVLTNEHLLIIIIIYNQAII